MAQLTNHPLLALERRPLDGFQPRLACLEPTARSGWVRFALSLFKGKEPLCPPVLKGIYSIGGRGVSPWLEVQSYEPVIRLATQSLDLADRGLDVPLFSALAALVPPGGHLMLWCESHPRTHHALLKGIPPVATPLGALLFTAGFPRVKFFDLAEGGWEGEQKLWAEKPPDQAVATAWRKATLADLRTFLNVSRDADAEPFLSSRTIAKRMLRQG